MKIFTPLFDMTMNWSRHKNAPYYLSGVSFAESVFFPIPPDVMLAPMSLAKPERAWSFALFCTIASVLGGIVGFMLGKWLYDPVVLPFVEMMGYQHKLEMLEVWFKEYGIWIVFVAGFSPIPYKVFTVGAGMMGMMFLPFVLASAVSRGLRFFLVAGLMKAGGQKAEDKLRQYVDVLGWAVVILAVVAYLIFK